LVWIAAVVDRKKAPVIVIRKQTLEEWFLAHQLGALAKNHFYNQILIDADVTRLVRAYRERGDEPPYTAILIKATAMAAAKHRCMNRAVFSTFYGRRVVEPEGVHVNFPHYITDGGRDYLIASTVPDADRKTVAEIRAFVKQACNKKLSDTVVARHLQGNANTFVKRTLLRLIHFAAYNFPSMYVKRGGGGVSVTSLMNLAHERFSAHVLSYGPTAFTVASISAVNSQERTILKISLGFDHISGPGREAMLAARALARILSADTEESLAGLT
jgi:pyruvate/2-oxoglutarate dehydrogenase complex dihydrolipoamide acyltransferase (E2) component